MNAPQTTRFAGWRHLATDPLIHFLLLGALVFAADQWFSAQRGDPQTIAMSEEVRKEARQIFQSGMKREPDPAEMKVLMDRWIDNEVLYREGLALGLDRGDSSIRDRVIFKALSITQAGLSLPKIDREGLRQWFESNRDRYDDPVRFDFFEAVVTVEPSPEALKSFVEALNGQGQSETDSSLRVFKDRPRNNLLQSYGAEFTAALERLPVGLWTTLPSAEGPRVVRLERITPATPAEFEAVESVLYRDWKESAMAELTTKAVREMGKKYQILNQGGER